MAKPRDLPELLSPADMARFFGDPDFRAARRQDKLAKLPPPRADRVLRGYRRDWLFSDSESVAPVQPFPDDLAALLKRKTALMRPLTDKITAGYDIGIAHRVALARYIQKPADRFRSVIRSEEHDAEAQHVLEQAANRMPVEIGDNLQFNLWLKMRIANIRGAFINRYLAQPGADWAEDDLTPAVVADAVADFGYCLRQDKASAPGLLKNIGQDVDLAQHIEHVGLYAADGHTEFLAENVGLIDLVGAQQQVRGAYWGKRLEASREVLGNTLPKDDRIADREIGQLLEQLYGQPASE